MPLRLSFHGAAGCVTGSCFALETAQGRVLIDCGLFQGSKSERELNYRPFPFDPREISAVILSHAHIDHSGLLPKLVKHGFTGPIHATAATVDLCSVMLPDSAHIQQSEVENLNRRKARKARDAVEPIYDAADADACIALFRPEAYRAWFDVIPGLRVRFWNAGHLLGSTSIEIEVADGAGSPLHLLFSGDIGPDFKLLQPDPEAPAGFDYVICEATYGARDRIDADPAARRVVLTAVVKAAMHDRGVLLIPSFAVERAQELVADLVQLMAEDALPQIPIYVDSPLATKATRVFAKHAGDLDGGHELVKGLRSRQVHFTETMEQSKALDHQQGFHIVIAASGMCEAGRIRHRLKNWIWRDEATVLLVGYQAEGTLGRIMQTGARSVRIQGEDFAVRARIRSIDLYSGHADGPELARWVRERCPIGHKLFLVHGEDPGFAGLTERLAGIVEAGKIVVPALDDAFDLTATGAVLVAGATPPRLDRELVGRFDRNTDVAKLMLDITDALDAAPDERTRAIVIRRLRHGLDAESETVNRQ